MINPKVAADLTTYISAFTAVFSVPEKWFAPGTFFVLVIVLVAIITVMSTKVENYFTQRRIKKLECQ